MYEVEHREVAGGADVFIRAKAGHVLLVEDTGGTVTVRVRRTEGPRLGERIIVHNMLVKVADRRYDEQGRLWVMDEDTGAWMVVE